MKKGTMIDVENNVCMIHCCLGRVKREDSTDGPRLSFRQRFVRYLMRCLRRKRRGEHQEREIYSLT